MVVGRPGRSAASRRRSAEGGRWVGAVGIVSGSGALERGEGECGQQAPELDGSGHPACFVVMHGVLLGLDGHELLGVDVLGCHAEAFEAIEGGVEHRRWAAEEDFGAARVGRQVPG